MFKSDVRIVIYIYIYNNNNVEKSVWGRAKFSPMIFFHVRRTKYTFGSYIKISNKPVPGTSLIRILIFFKK